MFIVIYQIFKKASKPLKKKEKSKWLTRVSFVFLLGIPTNLYMLYMMEVDIKECNETYQIGDRSNRDLLKERLKLYAYNGITCTSKYWVTNAVSQMLKILIFYFLVRKVDLVVRKKIQQEMKEYGYKLSDFKT